MTKSQVSHIWDPSNYSQNSSVQLEAALHLLDGIQLRGNENVLDVGCGDGKITAMIAKRVPKGNVLGIEISIEMINFARKSFNSLLYPNLTFERKDAQQFNYHESLDVIFSSFVLQWLRNPNSFFKCAYKSLRFSGFLLATIPLGISCELEQAISVATSLPRWRPYFQKFHPDWCFLNENEYKMLIEKNNFCLELFSKVLHEVTFPSKESFEKYVIQWFSYLSVLPQRLRKMFFNMIIEKFLELSHLSGHGSIKFKFPRIDLVAKKN